MLKKKILLGLTTTNKIRFEEWFEDIDKYEIKELALFPTVLDIKQRKKLYDLLDHSPVNEIPHVHIRHDFEDWEFYYFIEKYNTQAFNIHAAPALKKIADDYKKFNHLIYVENLTGIDTAFLKALDRTAGICIDFTHWEDGILMGLEEYRIFEELVKNQKVGCCHLSAVKKHPYEFTFVLIGEDGEENKIKREVYSSHRLESLSEMDYIKRNSKYLPDLISIELENNFKEQLEVKSYLEKIINS